MTRNEFAKSPVRIRHRAVSRRAKSKHSEQKSTASSEHTEYSEQSKHSEQKSTASTEHTEYSEQSKHSERKSTVKLRAHRVQRSEQAQ